MKVGYRQQIGWWFCLMALLIACGEAAVSPLVGRWRDRSDGSILTFTADGVMERDTGDFTFCYVLDEPLFGPTTMTIQAIGASDVTSPWIIELDDPELVITFQPNPTEVRHYERIIEDTSPVIPHGTGKCPQPN
jgi:hypothetical protein